MTVSSQDTIRKYLGDGVTTTFLYNLPFIDTSDLVVTTLDTATAATVDLEEGTDYDISGTPVNGRYVNGANVVFYSGYIPLTGIEITISRRTSLTQEVDYLENDNFPAETHEGALDKLLLISQEVESRLDRAPSLSVTTAMSNIEYEDPEDGKGFYFDAATNKFKNTSANLEEVIAAAAGVEDFAAEAETAADNAAASAVAAAASAAAAASVSALNYASVAEQLTGTATNRVANPDTIAALWEKGADIASASTINIPATGGASFTITGTTTITALSQGAALKTGRRIRLTFSGILTLTHNATSLILPNATNNITTAAGDVCEFECIDSTNNYWRCLHYQRADGQALQSTTATAASQAQQEAASSTSVFVTPGRQQYHPSAAKGWLAYNRSTSTILSSYNVTSVSVASGNGYTKATWTTAFSATNYCAIGNSDNGHHVPVTAGILAATCEFYGYTYLGNVVNGTYVTIAAFGDQ